MSLSGWNGILVVWNGGLSGAVGVAEAENHENAQRPLLTYPGWLRTGTNGTYRGERPFIQLCRESSAMICQTNRANAWHRPKCGTSAAPLFVGCWLGCILSVHPGLGCIFSNEPSAVMTAPPCSAPSQVQRWLRPSFEGSFLVR